ncbi:thioredoxin-dependent thiol peroxidase [Candidatus Zixiibacteriota bacterium]
MKLAVGDPAPDFTLSDHNGEDVTLSDLKGSPVVLYFYPKDNTPGCTTEACDFRDNMARILSAGAMVLGVSGDSAESHQKFREKFDLPFPLLVDDGHAVMEAYGAWGEKKMYGKVFKGLIRSTFLIDSAGKIAHAWYNVRAKGHVDTVLAALDELQA